MSNSYQDAQPSYVNMNVTPDTYSLSRRSSSHLQQVPSLSIHLQKYQPPPPPQHHHQHQQQVVPPSEELCSTCSSETESSSEDDDESGSETEGDEEEEEEHHEEKEIFIDFKPRVSPMPSPSSVATKKKKKLIKAMSEGEILLDDNGKGKQIPIHSASEEDLGPPPTDYSSKRLEYGDAPIRDEDIFKADKFLSVSPDANIPSNRYCRESFRKRSVSLEDPLADDETTKKSSRSLKTYGASTSGSPDGKSSFASSDDITRDHSDGNWNESQTTVLPRPPR